MNGKLRDERGDLRNLPLSVQTMNVVSEESRRGPQFSFNIVSRIWTKTQHVTKSAVTFTQKVLRSNKSGYSTPMSKGPKRPKYESKKSMRCEPKTLLSGHSILESETGTLPGQRKRIEGNLGQRVGSSKLSNMTILSFCLSLLFAASIASKSVNIASHNLHSFKKSGAYHKQCLHTHGGIWMSQELWLSEKQLPTLQQLGTQFVARSGMEDSVSNGIMVGRPFGGVCISWSPDLDHLIFPIANFRHKRIVGVELKGGNKNYLLLCVYMPFFDSSNRAKCMTETVDALSMMETIIEQFPLHEVVIGGDINTEFKGKSPFDSKWNELMTKYQLASCDHLFPPDTATYHHQSLGHKKFNDHVIVSRSLINDTHLSNFSILEDGDNLSDHYPITMNLVFQAKVSHSIPTQPVRKPKLKWAKISELQKEHYTERLRLLEQMTPPAPLHCQHHCRCRNADCLKVIQREYDSIVGCLQLADRDLPRFKPGLEKDWWGDELTDLRNESISIHNLWVSEGRPRQGNTNTERLRVRAAYKRAIRSAQRTPNQRNWDRLHTALADDNTDSFWKSWRKLYNKNKGHLSPVVDGCSSSPAIADCFKESFQKNSTPNNRDNVNRLDNAFQTRYHEYVENHASNCDCNSIYITPVNVIDGLLNMKSNKSADDDDISAEHLHNAPLSVLTRIASLFNAMLNHSFVPKQFRLGFMVPIIKDQSGNHSDSSNYRGITISPIVSKLFEHCLKNVFFESLSSSQHQFGFKKNSSTVHALHCLKNTVNHYIDHGSRVFCTFLDASKAFDRLVHSGLFLKLMERKTPLVFLEIIISWYDGLMCRVKWGETFSPWFAITAGVRQGGVLSPDFYCLYVDGLLQQLKQLRKGCHFLGHFAAAFFYADDMCVLSPSIKGLDHLLRVCVNYCAEWDINLNSKKSHNLYFGRTEISYDIILNGKKVEWTDTWNYLGVMLRSSKQFNCSVTDKIKKFYRCANSILRIDGRSNDMVMLRLIESHCIPLLSYAIEVVHVADRDERRQLRVAYNSVFRKIFCYRWSQSVTMLQTFLKRPTWEQLVEKRKNDFLVRVNKSSADTLARVLMA